MDNPRARIATSALEYSRAFAAVAALDDGLARVTLATLGDVEFAVVWLAMPLPELMNRTPLAAWADGETEVVLTLLRREAL